MGSVDSSPHVLMVDTGEYCHSIEEFLNNSGVKVVKVADSEKALSTAKSPDIDVVITDMSICMPSGESLVEVLCNMSPSKAVIVVGSMTDEDAIPLLDLGAVSYFKQPLDLADLEKAVRHVSHVRANKLDQKKKHKIVEDKRYYEFSSSELDKQDLCFETANMLREAGLITENERLRFELAFQEALANAHEHGNLELESVWKEEFESDGVDRYTRTKAARVADAKYGSRKVRIWMEYNSGTLSLRMKDEGKGFVENTLKENPDNVACYGRGITILNATMDHIEYLSGGSEILMKKVIKE